MFRIINITFLREYRAYTDLSNNPNKISKKNIRTNLWVFELNVSEKRLCLDVNGIKRCITASFFCVRYSVIFFVLISFPWCLFKFRPCCHPILK